MAGTSTSVMKPTLTSTTGTHAPHRPEPYRSTRAPTSGLSDGGDGNDPRRFGEDAYGSGGLSGGGGGPGGNGGDPAPYPRFGADPYSRRPADRHSLVGNARKQSMKLESVDKLQLDHFLGHLDDLQIEFELTDIELSGIFEYRVAESKIRERNRPGIRVAFQRCRPRPHSQAVQIFIDGCKDPGAAPCIRGSETRPGTIQVCLDYLRFRDMDLDMRHNDAGGHDSTEDAIAALRADVASMIQNQLASLTNVVANIAPRRPSGNKPVVPNIRMDPDETTTPSGRAHDGSGVLGAPASAYPCGRVAAKPTRVPHPNLIVSSLGFCTCTQITFKEATPSDRATLIWSPGRDSDNTWVPQGIGVENEHLTIRRCRGRIRSGLARANVVKSGKNGEPPVAIATVA
ncbi:hypothetical protein DYB28_001980 [Aphanomyces astaci]|uniref:Uncharacterized protein n=1 Tax=Aphanomyces astaci TaxID=112090 RepID=A0A9X8HGS5_APHAT|nr:hypothetical protein DYB28_001980 [Aphanomyces astaci]